MPLKILNTKPEGKSSELDNLLKASGYTSVHFPLLEIQTLNNPLFRCLDPNRFDGVFCSSTFGYGLFLEFLPEVEKIAWSSKPIYTLSKAAKSTLEKRGGQVAFTPGEASLQGFLNNYTSSEPGKWLHPCSLFTRLVPQDFLKKRVKVLNIPCYRPALPHQARSRAKSVFSECDGIVFTSGSAVENCFKAVSDDKTWLRQWLGSHRVATLGPSASEVLERERVYSYIQAKAANNTALVAALG